MRKTWLCSKYPQVILAPMDGYTDPPFRRFIKQVAPRAVVFSEFLPSTQIARKPSLAEKLFRIYPDEEPVVIQLYGKDPEDFRIASVLAEEQGASGVDINMGCPAKKVVAHRHGSALMREIDLACEIVAKVKKSVSVPVSVKTRLGWEDERNLIPFVKRLVESGLDAITIHGRTYQQKFEGNARWEPIYDLKAAVGIPVFGNGDITCHQQALEKLGTLDGVMIGRGAIDDPWLLARVCDVFMGWEPKESIPFSQKAEGWKSFARMMLEYAGVNQERQACQKFRKYLVRLHRELGLAAELRSLAVKVENYAQVVEALDLFASQSEKPHVHEVLV